MRQFTACAKYIVDNLTGKLRGQKEGLLSDSPHVAKIRIWSLFASGIPVSAGSALVAEDPTPGSTIAQPRRDAVVQFLSLLKLDPDIVFLATRSPTHDRASAYGTTDNDAGGGIAVKLDSGVIHHRFHHLIPGMATIHSHDNVEDNAMTAAHEFGHAFSSYTNGFVTDLYIDGGTQFNRKVGRPIPSVFANYGGKQFATDMTRDSLSYPASWKSFHPALADPSVPAVMDDYWQTPGGPLRSLHDTLTKQYILDRIAAKTSR
jgi:hypothetical protein